MTGISYVTNDKGQKTAVQIPLKQWDELQKELEKLKLLEDLKQAFHEMKRHKDGKLVTLSTKQLLEQL